MMMENCQLRDITDDECKDNNCWSAASSGVA